MKTRGDGPLKAPIGRSAMHSLRHTGSRRRSAARCAQPVRPGRALTIAITAVGTVVVLNVPGCRRRRRPGGPDRHPLRRAGGRLGVRLRARRQHPDRRRAAIPAPLRTTCATASRSTATPARGHLDRDPGDHHGRALRSPAAVVLADIEETKAEHQDDQRHRRAVRLDLRLPGRGRQRAGELHLVKDTPYLFKIRAKDVLHSFWVPEFRMKKDAVPGHDDGRQGRADPRRAPTRSCAPSSAVSGTRRCARRSWSRTRPRSTAGPSAQRQARSAGRAERVSRWPGPEVE